MKSQRQRSWGQFKPLPTSVTYQDLTRAAQKPVLSKWNCQDKDNQTELKQILLFTTLQIRNSVSKKVNYNVQMSLCGTTGDWGEKWLKKRIFGCFLKTVSANTTFCSSVPQLGSLIADIYEMGLSCAKWWQGGSRDTDRTQNQTTGKIKSARSYDTSTISQR